MRTASRSATAVLLYHRVFDAPRDPLSMCVGPERFSEHLAVLRDVADIVSMDDLRRRRSARGRRILLTFDDGYADNEEMALPLLRAAGVPATFMVASEVVDGGEFWWDRLEHLVLDAEPRQALATMHPGGRRLSVDVRTPAGRGRAYRALTRRLRVLPPEGIESGLAEVAHELGTTAAPCEHHRRMDAEAVRRLAACPDLVEVGAHSRSHCMLSALSPVGLHEEVAGCRSVLAGVTGRPVRSFAYPFGMRESYDRQTVAEVDEAGFDVACVNVPGVVRRFTHRLRMPRHQVYDWSGEELRGRLERVFAEEGA